MTDTLESPSRLSALPCYDQNRGLALHKAHGRRSCAFELAEKMAAQSSPADFEALKAMPITTTHISPGTALLEHSGGGGNMLVSHGRDGVVLVDLYYPDVAPRALAALREFTEAPLRFAIPTHFHIDHAGGAGLFAAEGALVIGQPTTRTRMAAPHVAAHMGVYWDAYPDSAWPAVTFEKELTLFLNDEEIVITQLPNGHTDTDTVVHFLAADVVHVGDIFVNFPTYPFLEMNAGANSVGILESVERVVAMCGPDTVVVPGHGPVATPADLTRYRDLLRAAHDGVSDRIARGQDRAEIVAAAGELMAEFPVPGAFIEDWLFIGDVYDSLVAR